MAILTKKLFCRSRRTRICSGFGYAGYDDRKPPFNPSSMVHFRKRLTPEILAEINEMVIRAADKENDQNYNNSGGNGNSGTMIEVRDYQDERERVEVERKFSLRKRKCGMDLVTAKLDDTAAHVIALSILLLNPRKIQYVFTISGLAARLLATVRKIEGCSVDIRYTSTGYKCCVLWRDDYFENVEGSREVIPD